MAANPCCAGTSATSLSKRTRPAIRTSHKGKSRDRIDGAVPAAIVVARCPAGSTGQSIYDSPADWSDDMALA